MKILLLAYDYPPKQSIGAQRPASWKKYLEQKGHSVRVIAGPWAEKNTNHQVTYCPSDAWMHRNKERGLRKVHRKLKLLISLTLGYHWIKWSTKYEIYSEARKLLTKEKFTIIIASGEPFILFKYASVLANEFGIPWIADYRDPWSTEQSVRKSSKLFTFLNDFYYRYLEPNIVRSAAFITTASEPYRELIKSVNPNAKIEIIPNGYDLPDMFRRAHPKKEKLVFGYLGRLYPHRDFRLFLDGFRSFLEKSKYPIEIQFYGLASFPDQVDWIREYAPDLKGYIDFKEMKPYEEVMKSAQDCHIFLMFSDGKSNFSPGKFYDYVGLNRPVWLSPEDGGFLKMKIQENKLGKVLNSATEVSQAISEAVKAHEKHDADYFQIPEVDSYSRKHTVELLENILAKSFSDLKK